MIQVFKDIAGVFNKSSSYKDIDEKVNKLTECISKYIHCESLQIIDNNQMILDCVVVPKNTSFIESFSYSHLENKTESFKDISSIPMDSVSLIEQKIFNENANLFDVYLIAPISNLSIESINPYMTPKIINAIFAEQFGSIAYKMNTWSVLENKLSIWEGMNTFVFPNKARCMYIINENNLNEKFNIKEMAWDSNWLYEAFVRNVKDNKKFSTDYKEFYEYLVDYSEYGSKETKSKYMENIILFEELLDNRNSITSYSKSIESKNDFMEENNYIESFMNFLNLTNNDKEKYSFVKTVIKNYKDGVQVESSINPLQYLDRTVLNIISNDKIEPYDLVSGKLDESLYKLFVLADKLVIEGRNVKYDSPSTYIYETLKRIQQVRKEFNLYNED